MLSLRRRRPEYSDYSSNLNTQVNYLHQEIYMASIHLYNRKAKINFSKMSLYILYCIYTRLLGRFAPIFYFNCEHILFVYIVKQKQTKILRIILKKFRGLSKFSNIEFWWTQIFENSIIQKPFLGSRETDRHTKCIYRFYHVH